MPPNQIGAAPHGMRCSGARSAVRSTASNCASRTAASCGCHHRPLLERAVELALARRRRPAAARAGRVQPTAGPNAPVRRLRHVVRRNADSSPPVATATRPGTSVQRFRSGAPLDWLLSLDGRERRRLTSPPAGQTDEAPRWIADGKAILFMRSGPTTNDATLIGEARGCAAGGGRLPRRTQKKCEWPASETNLARGISLLLV